MQHDIKKVKETPSEAQLEERRVAAFAFRDVLQTGFALRDEWRAAVAAAAQQQKQQESSSAAAPSPLEDVTQQVAATRAHLETIAPLLDKNPDCYSIFVFRRELFAHLKQLMALQQQLEKKKKAQQAAEAEQQKAVEPAADAAPAVSTEQAALMFEGHFSKEVLVPELKFNTAIIKKDYKSYAAWVHRRWLLNAMLPKVRLAVLQEEHSKLDQLLAQDERNFHAWGYRRWVTGELRAAGLYDDDKELAFAASKIQNNFSNYSAWHNRALVLWKRVDDLLALHGGGGGGGGGETTDQATAVKQLTEQVVAQINQDRDMLCNAFYCDPNDQSSFVYCKALIEKAHKAAAAASVSAELKAANEALQAAVLTACEELRQEESKCPWPLYMRMCLPLHPLASKDSTAAAWRTLQELDPMRTHYYASEIAKLN